MRVAVLPREVAASVITGSLSRMAWAFGATNLLLDFPVLIETYADAGMGRSLPLPLALLSVQLVALGLTALHARWWTLLLYLLIGGAAAVGFQLEVINTLPTAPDQYVFLLNRPAVSLVLIGVTASSTLVGISWMAVGFAVSSAVTGIVSALKDIPYRPGAGPALMMIVGVVGYLMFAGIQQRSRARVPDFDALEAETQRLVDGANLARRTTAVVHDTVLNDLAIVMNGAETLDERATERLRRDLDTLTSAEWISTARQVVAPDEQDVHVRNEIMRIISDLQWRGLSVQLSGAGTGIYRLDPGIVDALIDGIRAALENVLRHSGATTAELVFAYDDRATTIMVTDQGRGFDTSAIASDRLGVRASIVRRVEDAGGRVDVWSTPGVGTSVVMSAPIQRIVAPNPASTHRQAEHPDDTAHTDSAELPDG